MALSLAVIGFAAAAQVSVEVVRRDKAFQVEAKLMVAAARAAPSAAKSALDLLDEACARREIDREEFLQKRDDLQRT